MLLKSFALITLVIVAAGNRCQQNAAFYHFTIGGIHGTILHDGPLIFTQSPFLVPAAELRRSYDASFRSTSPLSLSQNVVVLDTTSGRVIVDPGSRGSQAVPFLASAGLLFDNLRGAGIPPATIDYVLLTHGHADHVNGLLAPNGLPAFPRAKVFIGRKEHRFWMTDPLPVADDNPQKETLEVFAETYRRSIAPYKNQLKLVPQEGSPLPGIRFIPTPGHSPGHNSLELTSGSKRLIISGDTWISKPDQVQNPEWRFGTETDPVKALDSRTRLLKKAARRQDMVLVYHEQFPGLGFVTQTQKSSFDWVPAPPQLLGSGISQKC